VLVFAIRSSSVQSFLANKATAYLSAELHTKISIEKVDIVLFKHIDLKNIFIQDLQKAKLLHLAHLNIDLDRIKLINKQKYIVNIYYQYDGNLERSAVRNPLSPKLDCYSCHKYRDYHILLLNFQLLLSRCKSSCFL
jgi:hypothetical protein